MKIRVPNWEKYNERSDRRNYQWFRLQCDWLQDDRIFHVSPNAKLLYLVILCEVCRTGGESEIEAGIKRLGTITGNTQFKERHLQELLEVGLVEAIAGQKQEMPLTDRQTDKQYRCDLDKIYQHYPKRPNTNKAQGFIRLEKEIKGPEDYQNLERAVCNYAKYCEAECTEPKFVKMFSTFAGCWREWIEIDPPLLKGSDWHG